MRWQRNPAYHEPPGWDPSAGLRTLIRVLCIAVIAFLGASHQWVGLIVFLVICFVAGVLDAIRT